MAFNISEIKANFSGGARQNQFQVEITNPANNIADIKTPLLVDASELPGYSLGMYPVFYFGRMIKFPGDRQFAPWTVTVMNDEDFLVRNAMEEWSSGINNFRGNVRTLKNFKSRALVHQYGKEGKAKIRTYVLEGLWPAQITPINLNWGDNDKFERFQVQFEFDDCYPIGPTGDAGGL